MNGARTLVVLAALLAPLCTFAAGEAAAAPARAITPAEQTELRALHQRELAACRSGKAGEALKSCLREAQASHAQALRGGLGDGKAPYAANARQRCEALRGGDRDDCLARMAGHGTVRGSVESGGILRELTTYSVGPEPAKEAATPASAPR